MLGGPPISDYDCASALHCAGTKEPLGLCVLGLLPFFNACGPSTQRVGREELIDLGLNPCEGQQVRICLIGIKVQAPPNDLERCLERVELPVEQSSCGVEDSVLGLGTLRWAGHRVWPGGSASRVVPSLWGG